MKNKILVILSVMAFLFGSKIEAEGNNFGVPAVYVVDMQAVVDKSKIGVEAIKKVKAEIARSEKTLDPKKAEIETERKNLEKQAGVLSEKAFQEKQMALVAKGQAFSKLVGEEQQKVAKVRAEMFGQVIEKARKAIEDLSVKNKYALVVEKSSPAVLYSGGAQDITSKIIEKIGG